MAGLASDLPVESVLEEQQQKEPEEEKEKKHSDKDTPYDDASIEEDNDEDETCGFCKFMKGGGCKEAFVAWSSCVDREREAGSDYTEECKEVTLQLRDCMLAHREYYAPLLEEEEEEMRRAAEKTENETKGKNSEGTEHQHEEKAS